MRIRHVMTTTMAIGALAVGGLAAPAHAADSVRQPFAMQAKSARLTQAQTAALKSKVSGYLKKVGGKQIALNEISFPGGRLRVALPGEAHPRDFTSSAGTQFADSPCLDGMNNGWFCAFPQISFQGDDLSWFVCGTYNMPWFGHGSWRNNQTRGTRAQFLNGSGGVIFTTPGAYSASLDYIWTPVFKIKIC